jgi:hypothetical protein
MRGKLLQPVGASFRQATTQRNKLEHAGAAM